MSSNSSRFGVRGTESLGGGLNAIFQIESNVSADSSGGQFATRETFAGLQGGWGTLKLGYFLTPYDDIQGIFGSVPTLMTGILGSQGLWANGGAVARSRRLRLAHRQFGALRLAEHRRLHGQRPAWRPRRQQHQPDPAR